MHKLLLYLLLLPIGLQAQPNITHLTGYAHTNNDGFDIARDNKTGNIFLLLKESNYNSGGPVYFYEYKWDVEILSGDLKQKRAGTPKALDLPNGKRTVEGKLWSVNGNTYAIFMVYNKKKDMLIVYRSAVSVEKGLGELVEIGILEGKYQDYENQVNFAFSADSSRFLMTLYPITNEKNMGGYTFLMLDQQAQVIKKGEMTMPPNMSPKLVGVPMVTNSGEIWAPVWNNQNDFQQEIWIWREGNTLPQRIDATPSKGHVATDLKLIQSSYDGLVYAGGVFAAASGDGGKSLFASASTFSKDKDAEQGTFILKIDAKNGQILTKTATEFTEKTLRFWGEKPEALAKEGGITYMAATGLIATPDGSLWINAEQFFVTNQQIKSVYNNIYFGKRANVLERGHHISESAVFTRYDAKGEKVLESVVGKSAWATSTVEVGTFLTLGPKNELIALYMDHEDNVDKNIPNADALKTYTSDAMSSKKRSGCVAMATLLPDGKTTTKNTQLEGKGNLKNMLWVNPRKLCFFYPSKGDKYGITVIEWP